MNINVFQSHDNDITFTFVCVSRRNVVFCLHDPRITQVMNARQAFAKLSHSTREKWTNARSSRNGVDADPVSVGGRVDFRD